jgi:hypothetical protein
MSTHVHISIVSVGDVQYAIDLTKIIK